MSAIVAGSTLGAYRILEQVGQGGMATVYKGYHASLRRYVAIKVLPAELAQDPGFRKRFEEEAVAIAQLRHPNILAVYDHGEQDGVSYIVTEFVDGGTLAEQLGRPLPLDYVKQTLGPIASALDYAHARGVIHRDVKPSNILLARDGTPVLSDFGLARMMVGDGSDRATRVDSIVGTPEYMSPEQCAGADATEAGDVYALGVIAYEMLTGRVPFAAATPAAVIMAQIREPLPLPRSVNSALSEPVEEALLKGLAKEPAHRYAGAGDLVRALAQAQSAAPPPAPVAAPSRATAVLPAPAPAPPPPPVPPSRTPGRRPPLAPIAFGLVVLLVLVAGGGYALSRALARPAPSPLAAAPSPQASPSPSPAGSEVVWDPNLDGTGSGFTPPVQLAGSPGAAKISFRPGAVDFQVVRPDGAAATSPSMSPPARYRLDFVVSADPGSKSRFIWGLRAGDNLEVGNHELQIDTASGQLQLFYRAVHNGQHANPVPLETTGGYTLADLASGQAVRVTVEVDLGVPPDPPGAVRYTVWLPKPCVVVMSVTDNRDKNASGMFLQTEGNPGSVHLLSARISTLPANNTLAIC